MLQKRTRNKLIILAICIVLIFVNFFVIYGGNKSNVFVTFFDVDQGDCIIIEYNNYTFLIDGGEKDYSDKIISYLKKKNITKLDGYLFSHSHSDHIGCASKIISHLTVDKVYMNSFCFNAIKNNSLYAVLYSLLNNKTEVNIISAGDSFSLSDLVFEVIGPTEVFDSENDMSSVIRMIFKNTSFLFTGDITEKAEKSILNAAVAIKSDVLKVPHHGSIYSLSVDFYDAVAPTISIICCGDYNLYGHPASEIIEVLIAGDQKIYRTDMDHNVCICSDGKRVFKTGLNQ